MEGIFQLSFLRLTIVLLEYASNDICTNNNFAVHVNYVKFEKNERKRAGVGTLKNWFLFPFQDVFALTVGSGSGDLVEKMKPPSVSLITKKNLTHNTY